MEFFFFLLQLGQVESRFKEDLEFVHLDGFWEEIVSAIRDGTQGIASVRLAADDDYFGLRCSSEDVREDSQSLGRFARGRWETQVQENGVSGRRAAGASLGVEVPEIRVPQDAAISERGQAARRLRERLRVAVEGFLGAVKTA